MKPTWLIRIVILQVGMLSWLGLHSQWNLIYDTNDYSFNALSFLDPSNGCVVGHMRDGGIILHTDTGGEAWDSTFVSAELLDIDLQSSKWGVACGRDGKVWITRDGGQNWEEVYTGTNSSLYSVECTGEGLATIAACCQPGPNYLLRTNDFGITWQINDEVGGSAVCFEHADEGMLAMASDILSTRDGGSTWEPIRHFPVGWRWEELHMDGIGNALLAGQAIDFQRNKAYWPVLKSTDSGREWTEIYVDSSAAINAVCMLSPSTFFVASGPHFNPETGQDYFHLSKSVDAGRTWSVQLNNFPCYTLTGIECKGKACFAVGKSPGYILRTTNQGGPPYPESSENPVDSEIFIYPNPTQSYVWINTSEEEPDRQGEVSLYDVLGRQIVAELGAFPMRIDLTEFPPGGYMVSVKTSRHQCQRKIMIAR